MPMRMDIHYEFYCEAAYGSGIALSVKERTLNSLATVLVRKYRVRVFNTAFVRKQKIHNSVIGDFQKIHNSVVARRAFSTLFMGVF